MGCSMPTWTIHGLTTTALTCSSNMTSASPSIELPPENPSDASCSGCPPFSNSSTKISHQASKAIGKVAERVDRTTSEETQLRKLSASSCRTALRKRSQDRLPARSSFPTTCSISRGMGWLKAPWLRTRLRQVFSRLPVERLLKTGSLSTRGTTRPPPGSWKTGGGTRPRRCCTRLYASHRTARGWPSANPEITLWMTLSSQSNCYLQEIKCAITR
ncbi:hypothetical protein K437DRAFT_139701 [Tilletiaria anomala UBC 951]|uniref:Uncharacterized protein n=1 Tax=Tilletiaria anomala (strain ATCC 24038 / CBS 436.72 / UBC 951) TaxID=1037660 RepID=A0A066VR72_TILAU|nr:uncharacterized protein K437DRAFT_139701 [Tilletiaria anomala UBC 951]KDN44242.1 hypothetical protein K437DRAFT_139701 [Tilletiaria anomala UBC 951]